MKKVPNRKVKVKLNRIILQILFLILVSTILITQKENILNIFTNKNKIKVGIPEGMQIGDIIKYDHKTGMDPKLLKTTIGKGTASIPGSGRYLFSDDPVEEQIFDASKIDTNWHVWSIDREKKEIMIVSDNIYPEFKTYGAIDYIWYEHNMHKIASIFGHGKGAKNKAFTYKVGSQLEDTGDTATWKTGIDGIPLTTPEGIPEITTKDGLKDIAVPLSGARPLRTEDIEKAFEVTESDIKSNNIFVTSDKYGTVNTRNIYFPQRDTGSGNQKWADKNIAKSAKQDVKYKDVAYAVYYRDLIGRNKYKNMLSYQFTTSLSSCGTGFLTDYRNVHFGLGSSNSDHLDSISLNFVVAGTDGSWNETDHMHLWRVATFLSSSDVMYRKSVDNEGKEIKGDNQESIWKMEDEKELSKLPEGMQIGDIVKYDHKDVLKIEDSRKNIEGTNALKTTIEKGTATIPGSTYKQDFDTSKIDTNWHVWGVDEVTGDVIIVSDSVEPFRTSAAIDYIWYEHNMHKIASIFGHGKGVKKKEFTYKVGSQLEDTGDTATWKTGINGIPLTSPNGIPGITTKAGLKEIAVPLSGARPLRTEDIEQAFGWTESTIKTDSKFEKRSSPGYGGIYTINIHFPQRDTGTSTQQWADKNIAKATKKDVKGKDGYYYRNKTNVPENTYKNILWDWNVNGTYQLGQLGLDVDSSDVYFSRGVVYSNNLGSANHYIVYATTDGSWTENDRALPGRVVAFLSSSDIVYRKSSAVGAHQELVWDIELKTPTTKNIKVNMKNEFGENLTGVKFNLSVDGGSSVLSRTNLNINSGSVNTFNGSNIIMKDNKYKMEVLGLPTDANYKIISKYEGDHELEQDIVSFGKEDLEYDILIYRKDGDYPVTVTYDEGAKNDEGFSLSGKIKLMDGENLVDTLDVTLKKGNTEFKFTDVKYFVDGKFKNYTIKYEGEGDVKVVGNELKVKYTPPKKNYNIKAEFIFDKTLDTVPVELHANGKLLKNIDLLKSSDYITSENLPERDSLGKVIDYTIKKGNIPSGYITEISGLTIIIRPVLTLPMTGSDSLKMLGITFGICTSLGFVLRKKKKMKMLNFNGVMK